jgi:hypothetical protein
VYGPVRAKLHFQIAGQPQLLATPNKPFCLVQQTGPNLLRDVSQSMEAKLFICKYTKPTLLFLLHCWEHVWGSMFYHKIFFKAMLGISIIGCTLQCF